MESYLSKKERRQFIFYMLMIVFSQYKIVHFVYARKTSNNYYIEIGSEPPSIYPNCIFSLQGRKIQSIVIH